MKILIVDDEVVNIELLDEYLKEEGYDTVLAENGVEALSCLERNPDTSLILLDRTMPVMGGLELMKQLRRGGKFSDIPIVMQTAVADNDSIVEGINAGAYYYLTKPYKKNVLVSIINAAIHDAIYKKNILEEMQKNRKTLGLLHNARFELKTMEEAQNLAYFIAGSFPDPDRVVLGLSEILLNAVEHGNLGISYDEKSRLMVQGRLKEEILSRENMSQNKLKKVVVFFEKNAEYVKVTVKDEGLGFDWKNFLVMRPERATDPNGRGIVMARMSFDYMQYNAVGNEVCCSVNASS